MRLSKVKMSGFKSFVDPTTIQLPSNLVGIVGPNGCGKSNIIDAVRWVMGESSAKQLRGDSMADVIFNGSSARKPVSSASIELLFDNSDGAIGGQYASYAEISVRREVVRDGTSNYFLNGARCRRRDIQDLFLGTGLGPRSYAIIEQGTISRLVESKPEELRVFLEEAAGISKYKERRRETENRIHHARENIERLNDLREEIAKQLQHLQRQARAAERYKEFAEQQRALKAQIGALHWRDLDTKLNGQDNIIRERDTAFEAAVAEQRRIESELETTRTQHDEAHDAFNKVQGRYYELGANIARLEQGLQHAREMRRRQQTDLEQSGQQFQEMQGHITRDQQQLQVIAAEFAELEPGFANRREIERQSAAAMQAAEQAMSAWQSRWEEFNLESGEASRSAEVGRHEVEHLERQINQNLQRRERLEQERGQLSAEDLQRQIETLAADAGKGEQHRQELQAELEQTLQSITSYREQDQKLTQELHRLRSLLEDHRGRLASLEALQQAALGKSRERVSEWLRAGHLDGNKRLAELINVTPGWERAVETVLGWHLEAVQVDDIAALAGRLGELDGGSLSFIEDQAADGAAPAGSLLSKVSSPVGLAAFLGSVKTADTLDAALAMRSGLSETGSVITPDGIWMGRHWARVIREQDERAGVIAREQELKQIRQAIQTIETQVGESTSGQQRARDGLKDMEARRDLLQGDVNRAHRDTADINARLNSARTQLQQVTHRIDSLDSEKQELAEVIVGAEAELKVARNRIEQAIETLHKLEQQRDALQQERDRLRMALDAAREQARVDRESAHELALKLESRRSLKESTEQNMARMQAQLAQLEARTEELKRAIDEAAAPIKQQESQLSELLVQRTHMDAELAKARHAVENLAEMLRELEQTRLAKERAAQTLRDEVQQLRLGSQELRVRRQTIVEQLTEEGYALEQVLEGMPEDAVLATWAERLSEIEQKINRLGPINMAAIEDFAKDSEKKEYLDKQLTDLTEALTTLENAIRKIDRETRTRFKETFDRVNAGLQASFPKLFGGGHAYLELTGEELLDAGVAIMARPPGKRNSTIHLLSGGEKALVAISLVFSIFELNPAPFCMLDEVDAPLDEANIGRFCDLVRSMSDRVQFIVITHNKATMEVSNQLVGVTMSEPGVSRLVAVDVDEAVRIAAM
ncbi:MAG TPA: chromosome segregation protein SMC [Gammaproteobacteria bacterium]|nr:chromosome segregation protein SMC [Gammaproteobacteria bacterium]